MPDVGAPKNSFVTIVPSVNTGASFIAAPGPRLMFTTYHIGLTFANGYGIALHIMRFVKYTAFYREMRGHSVPYQCKLVRAYVKQRGGALNSEYTAELKSGRGQRDEWIARVRTDEVAIVAGLYVIPEGAAKTRRPSADYASAMTRLHQRAGLIVDVISGLTSEDGDAWADLVHKHATKVSGGRILVRAEAQRMNRLARKVRGPAIKVEWAAPNMKREFKRWSQWWRDPTFPSARDAYEAMLVAHAAMPEEDRPPPIGSLRTAIELFGRRKPNDPSAGGRPPTKKRKRKPT